MAPPTGPRAGGHVNRPTVRGARGAGVGKRRATSRTDRDGDVSMDSMTKPPTGPSALSTRGGRGARGGRSARSSSRLTQNIRNYVSEHDGAVRNPKAQFNKVFIRIHGLKDSKAASNSDGGLRSLLDFLERKSSHERPITFGKGVIRGDDVWLKVNQVDAHHLLKLNGFTFAGAPLVIEESTGPIPEQGSTGGSETKTSDTKEKLLAVLASRYNIEQKLLDLSALGADQTLRTMGAFENKALAEKSFKALMRLTATRYDNAAEKESAIQAVTLANNDILDVGEVFTLAQTLPRLRRLDLSGNQLQDFHKLSKWRHEFRLLEELHLVGNPLTNLTNYPTQVIESFPSLQILDGHRVRTPEEAAEALKAWFPVPFPRLPSNLRDGENNVASTFVANFFTLYDHDRLALVRQFYDAESVFSLNMGTEPASSPYPNYSRNLEIIGVRSPSAVQRLFSGGNVIAELWARLPATRHISLEQAGEWQIDCHTFPGLADPSGQGIATGLVITVQSRFEEVDPTKQLVGTRAFSRSFVLGPSLPGAPHPYRVVSDELSLRAWVPQQTSATAQVAPAVAVPVPPPAAAPPAPPLPSDLERAQMILELSNLTGMNAQYSELCLAGLANWDFNLALRSFEEKKAELPPEAFAAPTA
ncbi:hypothetical protein N657DRAFT_638657 [Parathielavia appendiculata]|uniref:mRNA export factor MEX67 n=1 Tax=Parathielavia appendiculata TaxID=2587402 RepID=A0AAN6U859_9PEZI|nr:hypothetical protein N657DRAFT_638657 [Parathielavia appendiculata]